jgi:hypothetical protein
MANKVKPGARTPAVNPLEKLFEGESQDTRDALALHKSEQRRKDHKAFMERTSLRPDIET